MLRCLKAKNSLEEFMHKMESEDSGRYADLIKECRNFIKKDFPTIIDNSKIYNKLGELQRKYDSM